MKKTLLTTCNAKYIHKNLALRWFYVTCPHPKDMQLKEFTIKDDNDRIIQDILARDVEVVCFSCYIWNIEKIRELIHALRAMAPTLHIIVGGPEVSYESFALLQEGVDAISIGEGEQSLWNYITMLSEEEPYEVAGMYTKQFLNREYQRNDIAWLETFPDPYFLDIDQKDMGKRYFYFETSRGCPYQCTYCLSSNDRCVRMFSMSYVYGVLDKLARSDVRQVKLLDRTFNCDPKRALAMARYMNDRCKKQLFQFEIVAETLSEELLTFFCEEADTTRFRFEIGVQSFHAPTLASVGRIQDNRRLKEVIRRLRDAGCTMHVDLIAGLPYENMKQFALSFDELFALSVSEVQLGILKLLKGTHLRSQQVAFKMKYESVAPYTIQSNQWLHEDEIQQIDACAHAVEKFWNDGTCRFAICEILRKGWYTSAFALFMDLGKQYALLPRPYQVHELFQCFDALFFIHHDELHAMLAMDYYAGFKQKPHRFFQGVVTNDDKKRVLQHALTCGIANQNILFRYGMVEVGYWQGKSGWQLILYNADQDYPLQYYLTDDLQMIKEVHLR